MKIHMKEHSNVTVGAKKRIKVAFETNSVAFFATFSGLASDKIGYPVRELSTNAWDASRGNFEVHLPTSLSPIFRIRDYGTGMSEDAMENIYARPFSSTKRDDDNSVGGWGLGSKSPYAYLINDEGAGSYNVTSYHDGMMRSYELSIGSDGMPNMDEIYSGPSDAPSGMEVSFPVKREDIHLFVDRVRSILWSFTPRPQVFPAIKWAEPAVVKSGENWIEYDGNAPFDGPHVRMGCVMYPIDLSKIQTANFLNESDNVLFDAQIGSLKPTLSREELAYDERTRQTLQGLIHNYEHSVISQLQEVVNGAETYFGASRDFEAAAKSYGSRIDSLRRQVNWEGRPLLQMIGTDAEKHLYKTMILREGWSHLEKFEMTSTSASYNADALVVMEHNPHYSIARLQQAGLVGKKLLWIRCKKHNREQVLHYLGDPEVITLDDYKVSVERIAMSKTIRKRRVLNADQNNVHREVASVDLAAGGYYVKLTSSTYGRRRRSEEYAISDDLHYVNGSNLDTAITTAIQLGVLDPGQIVVQRGKDTPLPANWELLGDDLIDGLNTKVDTSEMTGLRKKTITHVSSKVRTFCDHLTVANAPLSVQTLHADAKALCDTLRGNGHSETDSDKAVYALTRIGKAPELPQEVADPIADLEKRFEQLTDTTLPLLSIILKNAGGYYGYTEPQKHLDHYFDLLARSGHIEPAALPVPANDDIELAEDTMPVLEELAA
jgi:hypothetical protein